MCYFLNFGYNHGQDCYRLLDAETGRGFYSRDVTWPHPEIPCITPLPAAPIEPPRDIYVPLPQSVPVPSPAPFATPPAPAPAETLPPPPTLTSNSPAPIPPRVTRELEYEGYEKMRTPGEIHALRGVSREYAHRHGLPLDHAAMVSMLAKGEAINEIVHQHGASKVSPDLPTAHASDLLTRLGICTSGSTRAGILITSLTRLCIYASGSTTDTILNKQGFGVEVDLGCV